LIINKILGSHIQTTIARKSFSVDSEFAVFLLRPRRIWRRNCL